MQNLDTGLGRRTLLAAGALALAASAGPAQAAATPGEVHVIAEITAKPGAEGQLRDLMRAFAQGVRSEPGCLQYDLLEVAATPGRFFTCERWADQASIEAHMKTPAIQALGAKGGALLASAPVQLFLNPVA